jgi:hypothetical protein
MWVYSKGRGWQVIDDSSGSAKTKVIMDENSWMVYAYGACHNARRLGKARTLL